MLPKPGSSSRTAVQRTEDRERAAHGAARRRDPKELKLWKLRCLRSDQGLVIPSPDGSPLDHANFHHREWRLLLKTAGVPHGTFHAA